MHLKIIANNIFFYILTFTRKKQFVALLPGSSPVPAKLPALWFALLCHIQPSERHLPTRVVPYFVLYFWKSPISDLSENKSEFIGAYRIGNECK